MNTSFNEGELVYFIPDRHKRSKSYFNEIEKVALGRVKEKPDVGYYLDDFEDMQYRVTINKVAGSETKAVFTPDEPALFPMQTKALLEKIKDEDVNWKTIKDREIVVLTYQDCKLRTEEPTHTSTKLVAHELLATKDIVTGGLRTMHGSSYRAVLSIGQTELRPIQALLVGVRINMKQRFTPRNYNHPSEPIDMTTDFKMVVRFPTSSWCKSINPGAASIGTYYLSEKAMCCVWFKEDYDEWLEKQEQEEVTND